MGNMFINSENRLRSGWRILVQFIAWFILLLVVSNFFALALNGRDAPAYALAGLIYILAGLFITWMIGRWLDRRKFIDFGFRLDREWWLDLAIGFLLGALILSVVFVIELAAGWLQITSVNQTTLTGPVILTGASILIAYISVAVNEELVFRGYQLRNLWEGLPWMRKSNIGVAVLLVLTSMVFGLLHMGNPGANWLGWVNITLAGALLGWAFILTGQLALPIGLHIAWNFFEEFVYGFPVNGQAPVGWLIGSEVNGPEILTGGAFGPDGGVILTIMVLIDALLVFMWVKARGRWKGIRGHMSQYQDNRTAPGRQKTALNLHQ